MEKTLPALLNGDTKCRWWLGNRVFLCSRVVVGAPRRRCDCDYDFGCADDDWPRGGSGGWNRSVGDVVDDGGRFGEAGPSHWARLLTIAAGKIDRQEQQASTID